MLIKCKNIQLKLSFVGQSRSGVDQLGPSCWYTVRLTARHALRMGRACRSHHYLLRT